MAVAILQLLKFPNIRLIRIRKIRPHHRDDFGSLVNVGCSICIPAYKIAFRRSHLAESKVKRPGRRNHYVFHYGPPIKSNPAVEGHADGNNADSR